jgi:predicted NACHT family NTPase
LTCAVFQQKQAFYSKRSKLYEEGLELLLEQWDKSREIERGEIYRDLSVERKLELLSYLAVKKFEQEQYVLFEQAEIEGYIAEFLGIGLRESRAVLKAIESQHGLLIERSREIWSFSHLTFQEYLIARYFCDLNRWQNLAIKVIEQHWREVFLLITEMVANSQETLRWLKVQVDYLVLKDDKLQKFLLWLTQKADSLHTNLKAASVRAFYFGMEFAVPEISAPEIGFSTKLVSRLDDISDGLHPLEYECTDISIDYCLVNMMVISRGGFIDPDFAMPDRIEELESELSQGLQKIIEEIPDYFADRIQFDKWQEEYAFTWLEEYRQLAIKHRQIGVDWKFTDGQEKILKQYYEANVLLTDCLNNSKHISDTFKQEIQEALLLPIAEIEKYNREKKSRQITNFRIGIQTASWFIH